MERGMISLSLTELTQLKHMSNQDPTFPAELTERLQHISNDQVQDLLITEETAQSLLDLLPPPHTISDPTLKEIATNFRNFIGEIQSQ